MYFSTCDLANVTINRIYIWRFWMRRHSHSEILFRYLSVTSRVLPHRSQGFIEPSKPMIYQYVAFVLLAFHIYSCTVTPFTKDNNSWLAQRPFIFNGCSVNRGLTSLAKDTTVFKNTWRLMTSVCQMWQHKQDHNHNFFDVQLHNLIWIYQQSD